MKTSKILSSSFTREWGQGANLTYYHNVQLEGESKQYNIGAKSQNPDWLQPGKTIDWEFRDEAKGSIKRVQQSRFSGNGGSQSNSLDIKVSTGLIVATILFVNGRINADQVPEMAVTMTKRFDEIKALVQ